MGRGIKIAGVATLFHSGAVRLREEQLKLTALAALEEIAREGDAGSAPRSKALRFVLAYLFSVSRSVDRWPFDNFWQAATGEPVPGQSAGGAAIGRAQGMNASLNAIYRAVGMERTEELQFGRSRG